MPKPQLNATSVRAIVNTAIHYFEDETLRVSDVCARLRDPDTRAAIACAVTGRRSFVEVTPLMVQAVFQAIPTALSSAFALRGEERETLPVNPTLREVRDMLETEEPPEMRARWRVRLVNSAVELHDQYKEYLAQRRRARA